MIPDEADGPDRLDENRPSQRRKELGSPLQVAILRDAEVVHEQIRHSGELLMLSGWIGRAAGHHLVTKNLLKGRQHRCPDLQHTIRRLVEGKAAELLDVPRV